MTVRTLDWLTLAGCIVAAVALHLGRAAPRAPAGGGLGSILEALPAGAPFVATVQVAALRRAGLFGEARADVPGLGTPRSLCGFDPFDVADVVGCFGAATGNGEIDVGFAALGAFEGRVLTDCAAKMIAARGGEPRLTPMGTFETVRDAAGRGGEVATRPGGPVLVGGASSLRQMLDATEGRGASAASDARLSALRRAVGETGALVASLVLEGAARRAIADALPDAPLAAVRAAALSISVGARVEMRIVVVAESMAGSIAGWLDGLPRELIPDEAGAVETQVFIDEREITARWAMPATSARRLLDAALEP